MYIAGIPVGLLVDAKGPRPGVLLGGLLLGTGYLILYRGTDQKFGLLSKADIDDSIRNGPRIDRFALVMFSHVPDGYRRSCRFLWLYQDM